MTTKEQLIEKIMEDINNQVYFEYSDDNNNIKKILEHHLQDTEEREVDIMQSRTIYPKCNCWWELEFNMNYCPECWAKIKWID